MDELQQVADESTALALEQNSLLTQLKKVTKIENADQYRLVAAWNATFKKGIAYFEERWRPHIRAADEQHTNLLADLKRDQAPSKEGSGIASRLLSNYDTEQERLRQQEQRRLEQEKETDKQRLADIAREAGQKKLAKEIEKRPAEPVVAPPAVPKVEGLSYREDWKYEITDAALLPREYLVPDEIAIGKVVRALKGSAKIPGIRVFSVKTSIQRM